MRNIHFLQFLHYVIYDADHDKELGIVTKSGQAFYDKLDADEEKLVKDFAKSEGEEYRKNFMDRFKTDHARLFNEVMNLVPYSVLIPKEDWSRCYEDAEYLYKFFLEEEKNWYEKTNERHNYRRH